MHNTLKLLLLLLAASCAPPKHSICFNPDPASGICRDAELRQAAKDKASAEKRERAQRLASIKQAMQIANTQLADKKLAITTAQDPQTVTRLTREHNDLVDEINNYWLEAKYELQTELGLKPKKIGEQETITLHLQQDKTTQAMLPVLGGLAEASDVQINYQAMQHKFPHTADEEQEEQVTEVSLPETLRITLHMQFTLDNTFYCGTLAITAKQHVGGKVATQLAPEEGC